MIKPIKPTRKEWNYERFPFYDITDYPKVKDLIKPQQWIADKALIPDCGFVFYHTVETFFLVSVAKDTDGYYHFGYTLHKDMGTLTCFPSPRWKHHKTSRSLRECLIDALKYIRTIKGPYERAATQALRSMSTTGVHQLSIFDIIDQ